MTFDEMKEKADIFFEFPTENRDHVTTTSCILFAMQAFNIGIAAANSLTHRAVFAEGYAMGATEEREALIELIHDVVDRNGWGWDGDCNVGNNIEKAIRQRR